MKAENNEMDQNFYDIPLGGSYKTMKTFQTSPQAKEQVHGQHHFAILEIAPNRSMKRTRFDTRIFPLSNKSIAITTCLHLVSYLPLRKCVSWRVFLLVIVTGIMAMFLYSHALISIANNVRAIKMASPFSFQTNTLACKLPKLDPFHKTVMRELKDLGSLECDGKVYTSLQGGKFNILDDEITEVILKAVRRIPGDDDEIEFENIELKIDQDNNETRRFLYEEFQGNIQHFNKKCFHPFGGLQNPRDNTHVVLHSDCGLKRVEFKLMTTENGLVIQHVPSNKCLQPEAKNSTKTAPKLIFSQNCKSTYRLLENGRLQHIASGLCISARNQTDTKRNEDDVILKNGCEHRETELYGLVVKGIKNETIKSEFVLVKMRKDGNTLKEFHLQALPKADVLKRPIKREGLGMDVFMFMFDSTSAAHFTRKMRKSMEFLENETNTVFFKGEGIVGDGTTAQLSAMLTGIAEEHQSEARRGKPGAKPVDDWRWIYKDFKNQGYATLLSEDDPKIASFNMRLLGFTEPPTDHYARPFWLGLDEKNSGKNTAFCFGSQAIHNLSFAYVRSFCDAYPRQPKFSLSIFSYLTHSAFNGISYADEDLANFLINLKGNNHLNNSLVIIFGDHGYRLSKFRDTTQGKLEERLPFLSITVPKWFPWKHPQLYRNLQHNSEVLTSPFDVYATLRHVLSYPMEPRDIITGQSLFNQIDGKTRTCADAGIEPHWCPCMQWENLDPDQKLVSKITETVLKHINNLTSSSEQLRQLCRPFELKEINAAWREVPNTKVQKFQKTKKVSECDSCVPIFGEKSTNMKDTLYQIQFAVEPGPAVFEASVRLIKGHALIDSSFISRINAYGDQSHCVRKNYTHLLKYCYCRIQQTNT